jgi:MerR family redox-sensitive transcriptional activator SoxR
VNRVESATLTIGDVAARAGVNASAIRYYEARGLLPAPERESGRRRYTEDAVRRLAIIDTAKQAGLSLDDITVLLDSADRGTPAHEPLRDLATRKLPEVRALIERAEAMRDWLETARGCTCPTLEDCALFDVERPASVAAVRG